MARKRKPEGNKPRRGRPPKQTPNLPDRRALEGAMRDLLGGEVDTDTPAGRAELHLRQAFTERDPQSRTQIAHQALAIYPDCADAYVLLAEHTPSHKEALRLYEQAVAAAERSLGPKPFQEAVGHFWGLLETRPYMRARQGLANSLWRAGRRAEAIEHLKELLRLNPGDNQGIRYVLAGFLLNEDRNQELAELLDSFPSEGSATWAWTHALLAFRRQGDTPESRRLLKSALKANQHVPAYLLGWKHPPADLPAFYTPGTESDALTYVGTFLPGWKGTHGALSWLRENVPGQKKRSAQPEPKGPLTLIKNWLNKNLPQYESVWQVDVRRMPIWIKAGEEGARPWLILVADVTRDLVLLHQILMDVPSANLLWDHLVQAMQHPSAGEPHRPTELHVRADERWEALRPHLEGIGAQLVVEERLEELEFIFDDMVAHLGGQSEPGLLEEPGFTPELVGSFYEAAADFFQQTPWRKVGFEAAIEIRSEQFQGGPWYGVVMGQSGLMMGLTLYEDLDLLRGLWADNLSDEENSLLTVATTVTYGDERSLPLGDLEAAERHRWKVARPDAYPSPFFKGRGEQIRPPRVEELELLEASLRAVPEFVNRRRQDDPTPEEIVVFAAGREVRLRLAWIVEE